MDEVVENRKKCNKQIIQSYHNIVKCSFSPAESTEHRRLKYEICEFCYKEGISFATEVTFRNNKRCDILIKDWCIIIQILNSEKIEDFLKKTYPYPAIPFTTDMRLSEIINYLRDMQTIKGKNWGYYYKKQVLK